MLHNFVFFIKLFGRAGKTRHAEHIALMGEMTAQNISAGKILRKKTFNILWRRWETILKRIKNSKWKAPDTTGSGQEISNELL